MILYLDVEDGAAADRAAVAFASGACGHTQPVVGHRAHDGVFNHVSRFQYMLSCSS